MSKFRGFLTRALLLPVVALTGCAALTSDYWQGPSVLGKAPPEPVKQTKHEPQGGLSVLVEAPGQPSVARATADIGTFAQRRGFVRTGPDRYTSGNVMLDVTFRAADSRVIATLHSSHLNRKLVEDFYRDFNREYARGYGEENPIEENDFLSD